LDSLTSGPFNIATLSRFLDMVVCDSMNPSEWFF
jgi:hypothetical protein